ncbi:MAG: HAMP domain-containing sensor histidine kinase [Thermodesulfovibrionia bacterium]|nr:HAMP domain-containing sensor histidine kinase [Thermodesulfovibrionia bacterium]
MRTKLFLAFTLVIFLAILSNTVFERFIISDFNNFLKGTEEDKVYWVMSSVEGSYMDNDWNTAHLSNSIHWGIMLGFETYVEDISGNRIISSTEVLSYLPHNMSKRMHSFFKLPEGTGEFIWYPLYVDGNEIGKLYIRPLERVGVLPHKEEIFRERGKKFLILSFLIAGVGALFLSILLTITLSRPIRRLTRSAEDIAKGDFSVKAPYRNKKGLLRYDDEIDRLTSTFNYMAEALRREDALRKHLTSNIAHELRTPLTIIKGNLEAIEDGVISDPRTVIKNINAEILRLISLVEGIKDVTSAEASFFKKGELQEVNLKEIISSVTDGMRKLIEGKGLYLKAEGPSMKVMTYPDKFHIILKNLLTNAYKYTDKGGITISWDQCKESGKAGFYLTVEDTGRGISADNASKVFERFYKGRDSDGSGLGLAIVKELTEVIGGKIELQSSLGMGSQFTIKFIAG